MHHPVPEGMSGQQTVDILQKRLELLGANKTGTFSVDCETWQSQLPSQQRLVHVMHNSESPASCFAILDTGNCLVADTPFDLLMQKLRAFYAPKKNVKVETKGQRYELGDFIIKVGSAVLGPNTSFKGILVEVEYCPCLTPSECWNLMKEFTQGFLGAVPDTPNAHLKAKMDTLYTPTDTVMQYLEFFNNFRKTVAAQQR